MGVREEESEREGSRKTPSLCVFCGISVILLHSGLPSIGRSPGHSSGVSPLYSPNSRYPRAYRCHYQNFGWCVCVSSFFLSHKFLWWEIFVCIVTELRPSSCAICAYLKLHCGGLSYSKFLL